MQRCYAWPLTFMITRSSGKKNVNNDLMLEINTSYLLFTFLMFRSIAPDVLVYEGVLNICSKIAGEDPCGSVVSIIKLHGNSMEIILPDGHFPVNLLNILRTPFYKNTFEELLLYMSTEYIRPVLSKVQNFFLENIRKNARKITTSFC